MIVGGMSVPEMEQYRGSDRRPEDFDAFWAAQLRTLSAYEPPYTLEKAAFQLPQTACFDLNFRSFDGARIHCKLAKPENGTKLPVLFWFHGYKSNSVDWWHKSFLGKPGLLHCRYGRQRTGRDFPGFYQRFRQHSRRAADRRR